MLRNAQIHSNTARGGQEIVCKAGSNGCTQDVSNEFRAGEAATGQYGQLLHQGSTMYYPCGREMVLQ